LTKTPSEYERLASHLEKNHFELSDLESRKAFAMLTLAQETKLIVCATGKKIFKVHFLMLSLANKKSC
jgi:hypothetical protein